VPWDRSDREDKGITYFELRFLGFPWRSNLDALLRKSVVSGFLIGSTFILS
jgi:hypothetical protein